MPTPRLSHGAVHVLQSLDGTHVSVGHGCVLQACENAGMAAPRQKVGGTATPVEVAQITDRVVTPVPHRTLHTVHGPVVQAWCWSVEGDGDSDIDSDADPDEDGAAGGEDEPVTVAVPDAEEAAVLVSVGVIVIDGDGVAAALPVAVTVNVGVNDVVGDPL